MSRHQYDHDVPHHIRPRRRQWDSSDTQAPDGPQPSSWPQALHGPAPLPDWVVTDAAATDAELGVLKTGKEADVSVVERTAPDGRSCLLAAKRATAARSIGCSTATPDISTGVGYADPGRCAPWPPARSSAVICWPGSGPRRSSPRCAD